MFMDDYILIAKALMCYKAELKKEIAENTDLREYSQVELFNTDELAKRHGFDVRDYYEVEP